MESEDLQASEKSRYVLDRGALLHRINWRGATFDNIVENAKMYVKSNYGCCTIVFGGYKKLFTKYHEHRRRAQEHQACADVKVSAETDIHHSREEFLTNEKNREQFINFLSHVFMEDGHTVINCEEDAETHFIDASSDVASVKSPVTVVADE